jgi:hypothetical protein
MNSFHNDGNLVFADFKQSHVSRLYFAVFALFRCRTDNSVVNIQIAVSLVKFDRWGYVCVPIEKLRFCFHHNDYSFSTSFNFEYISSHIVGSTHENTTFML